MSETPIDAFLHLLHETENVLARNIEHENIASYLTKFREARALPLFKRQKAAGNHKYTASFVGLTNVGKSTLTAALTGYDIAPARIGPSTAVPVEYIYGDEWKIQIHSYDKMEVKTFLYDTAEELAGELDKYVTLPLDDKAIPKDKVVISGPMELLKEGLTLTDTPGIGAGNVNDKHTTEEDKKLLAYLQENVHEIFFCVNGGNIHESPREKDFFEKLSDRCSTVIINKYESDGNRAKDIKRTERHYEKAFPLCRFIFVEAKTALESIRTGNGKKLERADISDVYFDISLRADPASRLFMVQQQLQKAMNDVGILAERCFKIQKIHWRKDSLSRFHASINRYNRQCGSSPYNSAVCDHHKKLIIPEALRET